MLLWKKVTSHSIADVMSRNSFRLSIWAFYFGSNLSKQIVLVILSVALCSHTVQSLSAKADGLPPDLDDFQLRPALNHAELLDRVKQLDALLPKLSVKHILEQANRQGRLSTKPETCNRDATALSRLLTTISYCFNPSDSGKIDGNVEWIPQGVTTVADAENDQYWNGKQPILISWYGKKPEKLTNTDADEIKGARVTFFDSKTAKYQHVLLVYPYINSYGNLTYMSLQIKQKKKNMIHCMLVVLLGMEIIFMLPIQ